MRMLLMQTGAVPASVAAGMSDQQVKDLLDALQAGGALGGAPPPRPDEPWGRMGAYGEAVVPGCTPGTVHTSHTASRGALNSNDALHAACMMMMMSLLLEINMDSKTTVLLLLYN